MARVLLVEDEKGLRDIVAEALLDMGHEATMAENGVEAIHHLAKNQYDVVISDISMPEGVSGIDLAEYIQAANIPSKVILVSGHARSQLPGLPENVSFLPKPYRLQQLLSLLQ
ncbi:MAG: response regulator [Alphaproteobacteria bacterium]|nr:MAG: response regulator [Alphaproteobacteria bacterium]